MSVNSKSPLHPSALTLSGMKPGRRIIRFNLWSGEADEYTILSRPFSHVKVGPIKVVCHAVIELRDVSSGVRETCHLTDMGVLPYSASSDGSTTSWNLVHFVIDAHKRHLLPSERLSYNPYYDDNDGWYEW